MLLHICCAPDATHPYQIMKDDYEITAYFYNPNIYPEEEYKKRLEEFVYLSEKWGLSYIVDKNDPEKWFEIVKGLEEEPEGGRRCEKCFEMRLEKASKIAKGEGFDIFGTVMTISPHKNSKMINEMGNRIGEESGIQYLESNFKKKDGFKKSIDLSKVLGLYRQDYCGCIFSKKDRDNRKESKEKEQDVVLSETI